MLAGSLTTDLLELLPDWMREEYELDDLLAADFNGQLWWLVRRATDYVLGPVVGPLFHDAMRSGWDMIHPEVEWA